LNHEYAHDCIVDIQKRINSMSKEEITQALEVVRVCLISPSVSVWKEPVSAKEAYRQACEEEP